MYKELLCFITMLTCSDMHLEELAIVIWMSPIGDDTGMFDSIAGVFFTSVNAKLVPTLMMVGLSPIIFVDNICAPTALTIPMMACDAAAAAAFWNWKESPVSY